VLVLAMNTMALEAAASCRAQGSIRVSNGINAQPPAFVINYSVVTTADQKNVISSTQITPTDTRIVSPWLLGDHFRTVIFSVPFGVTPPVTVVYTVYDLDGTVIGHKTVYLGNNQAYLFDPESVATPPGCSE